MFQIAVVSNNGYITGMVNFQDLYNLILNEAEKSGDAQSKHEMLQRKLVDLDDACVERDESISLLVIIMPWSSFVLLLLMHVRVCVKVGRLQQQLVYICM